MKKYRQFSEVLNVRIPHSMKKELQAQANKEGVSLSRIVKNRLTE